MNQEGMMRFDTAKLVNEDISGPNIEVREAALTAGNYRTHYITAGSGKDVILLHGAGGKGDLFKDIIPLLAPKYRLIIPDLLGHGRTQSPQGLYQESAYCSWLKSFISAMNLDKPDLVGHSLGGAIALRFAHRYPASVNRLVLVNSVSLGMPNLRATLNLLLAVFSPNRKMTLDLIGRVMFADESKRKDMMTRLFYDDASVPKGMRGFFWMLARSWWIGWPVSRRTLENLQLPVFLLWGEKDMYFPVSHARRAKNYIPQSDIALIPNSGHAPFLEQPELFVRKLELFLDHD